jgi:trypsin
MKRTIVATVTLLLSSQLCAAKGRRLRGHLPESHRDQRNLFRTKHRQRKVQEEHNTRIIGGQGAPAGKYPYIAEFELGCGGSLIAPDMILTVAHCAQLVQASDFVYIGSNILREGTRRSINPSGIIQHPQYDETTSAYDFLLVKLDSPVLDVEPVKLNGDMNTPGMVDISKTNEQASKDNGEVLTVIGFGVLEEGDVTMASQLQEAEVPYIPQETCQSWYKTEVVDEVSMFCAGYTNGGVDSCQGDSGSPILNEAGVQVRSQKE